MTGELERFQIPIAVEIILLAPVTRLLCQLPLGPGATVATLLFSAV